MLYITGDMHGDRERFQAVGRAGLRKGDTLLVCGDFGFVWDGSLREERLLKWIGSRKYQVLFVDGAHDNHLLLTKYPVEEAFGGRVRRIFGNLCMLLRGEVYTIEDKKIFAFGGGDSLERYAREAGDDLRMPTPEELDNARRNLEKAGNQVDLVITHDAPAKLRQFIQIDSLDELTSLQAFLEEISRTLSFRQWYIGKYHANKRIPPRFSLMFTAIQKYEDPPVG